MAGETGETLQSAAAALFARDAELGAADRVLADVVASAYRAAAESISRIESIRGEIEAAASERSVDHPAAGRELSRFLIAGQREIAAIVADAQKSAQSKTVVLQQLMQRYQ
ncbi:MAG: DUF4226 domain-containing protein [Mycobacterium sp.]|nr:DUF4226 domain-containing protein [Mycobacterium sp.]